MLLALKIDVDTYRGTREGIPPLVAALQRHQAGATFLWSLGPDHTGRAIKRVFRPGFLSKVSRTSVVEHYGIRTLLYGTLLPGPDIGRRCAAQMRAVRDAGFECGIHTYDHIKWQDYVASKDQAWTLRELERARLRYQEIFGEPPKTHGAAGWQMNSHAYRWEETVKLDYASDGRGTHPFWPVVDGQRLNCPQLPTTLPTLDELIGVDGLTPENVHEHLLGLTADAPAHGHVYTLHAELEGMRLLPTFERLLAGWRRQGYQLVSTRRLFEQLDLARLPEHGVEMGEIPGRSGTLALQGKVRG
ncbi:polysaccharide deacetylase family protein [Parachitinimonas caeni]|uniref:Polysaccharide deacetylase family protein n=1 Tax=Parachitinimonas caeni TaxID=3031301 RepID=A0ABT7DWK8_9NEIS|nr:polysaccharide deacetylase family protein [Parachitinimonas caeni]MDK2124447.1 polysaccharide deacetylase family protein [Parachitinimonas caeni]